MDQRDSCKGQLRRQLTSHLEIKGTRTQHHEQPFEYPGRAVEEIGQKEKARWLESWSSLDALVCKTGSVGKGMMVGYSIKYEFSGLNYHGL